MIALHRRALLFGAVFFGVYSYILLEGNGNPSVYISIAQQGKLFNSTKSTISNDTSDAEHGEKTRVNGVDQSSLADSLKTNVKFFLQVAESKYPALAAGKWVYKPEQGIKPSPAHLQCLDQEKQGNCHNASAISDVKARARRTELINLKKVLNSRGMLEANDSWVWESQVEEYKVLPYNEEYPTVVRNLLQNRTIFLIGDSFHRQWSKALTCELMNVAGFTSKEANRIVKYLKVFTSFPDKVAKEMQNATSRDYLVVNFGHHFDEAKKGKKWRGMYTRFLEETFNNPKKSFGSIPRRHIFFRTTTVRHYHRRMGDFNTNSSKSGGTEPNNHAQWSMYGGNYAAQPDQNMIALNVLTNRTLVNTSEIGILDTATLTLARADATFDGSHLCLPGPMEYWSRMLYYRIQKLQELERLEQQQQQKE